MNYNTIIIGAGMSGMTAAIYLKRANIDVCIIEKSAPGGQLLRTSTVENYPAYSKVDGATLAMNLYDQVNTLGIPIIFEEVLQIENDEEQKKIQSNKNTYTCKNIIIATGRMYRKLDLENEDRLSGRGISYCAVCDGSLYRDKDVAVIGAGNSAFEEALYLSNLCHKVTIIARKKEFRAVSNLVDEVRNKENIEIKSDMVVESIIGDEKLNALSLKNLKTGETEDLSVAGCFIYIGQLPETEIFETLNIEMENGYIVTDTSMQTNVDCIYACGDCRKKEIYQLVTATYDGVVAATQIIRQN